MIAHAGACAAPPPLVAVAAYADAAVLLAAYADAATLMAAYAQAQGRPLAKGAHLHTFSALGFRDSSSPG